MGSYVLKGIYRDPKTGDRAYPGDTVELDDREAHRLRFMIVDPSEADDAAGEPTVEGYDAQSVDELKDEIRSRNEGRDDDAKISLGGNKADLIAALEADDAAG